MRLLALVMTTALALPALAAAQTLPTLPTLDESPAERTVRRAAMTPPVLQEDTALQAAIGSDARPAADVARDVYRRPFESLTFWGLTPGSTVVEIQPGRAGWWTAILQPYAEATGGRYVAVNQPLESMGVEDGTADMVLVARAFHNWHRAGRTDAFLAAFFKALKPGGVLAVEQHRSVDGLNPDVTAPTGYMPESHIIRAAQAAGFVLDARSELNANPKDDRDHPFGVWTLPPVRTSAPRANNATDRPTPLTEAERAEYDAIGESDRMTLRFRKPE
ncbi:MAG: methyltransferase domain-containing protein [Alphaproteobacteria bacterium]|jgi:predicted methyltransferase|nr:methyltransferase domain-containing protein [Alphaproteobacteria bacterium]MBU2041406.1 methyltransferase domain-containing protein [Alphaproteobacteria bacterium]MBU2126861.1 methyltransferase domain-containing protein [Alphaproteobacteria bacterium]MBU2290319.1 methyltransferase domain-containing protein [Alphaproteobacteria bacterium]MBU2397031.1 methyltransferase domain-containing protein [Alphaproteobacteria bacterium]